MLTVKAVFSLVLQVAFFPCIDNSASATNGDQRHE